jgi:hypothetical protein
MTGQVRHLGQLGPDLGTLVSDVRAALALRDAVWTE